MSGARKYAMSHNVLGSFTVTSYSNSFNLVHFDMSSVRHVYITDCYSQHYILHTVSV